MIARWPAGAWTWNQTSLRTLQPDQQVGKVLSAQKSLNKLCVVWILFRFVENTEIEDSSELIPTLIHQIATVKTGHGDWKAYQVYIGPHPIFFLVSMFWVITYYMNHTVQWKKTDSSNLVKHWTPRKEKMETLQTWQNNISYICVSLLQCKPSILVSSSYQPSLFKNESIGSLKQQK